MPNPFLPLWEYIPDGEPRVFGDRVYLYGSHDRVNSDKFCDFKLKVWSAPLNNLSNWECHGHSLHTRNDSDHISDTSEWTSTELYAPDVIEKDGRYYLYSYICNTQSCVSISDTPEGPFTLLSKYKFTEDNAGDNGIFNDAGVLVDDDGRTYIYYGFERSFMNELNTENMYEVKPGTLIKDVIPSGNEQQNFFEASSPRKISGIYYLIYSPRKGSCLAYATADKPTGPFTFRGYIIDNSIDYPGGNDHGSVCCINGQWWVFYHKMTNNSIMSRRACAEKIKILPDGTIPQVEMTSLGFDEYLTPYYQTPAEIACVLKNGCFVTERNAMMRPITNITDGAIIGYRYFEFGKDEASKTMLFSAAVRGTGCKSTLRILLDDYENGEQIGVCEIGTNDGVYTARVKSVTGRHAVYFVAEHGYERGCWTTPCFENRSLFELETFQFMK